MGFGMLCLCRATDEASADDAYVEPVTDFIRRRSDDSVLIREPSPALFSSTLVLFTHPIFHVDQ